MDQDCFTCKFEQVPYGEVPCDECVGKYSKWQPAIPDEHAQIMANQELILDNQQKIMLFLGIK